MERTTFEIVSPYNLGDMFGLIKTPSPILDYIDKMTESISTPVSAGIDYIKYLFSDEKQPLGKRIKKGAYRGMTGYEKVLIDLTPARNLIRLKDIKSQRDYYNTKIRGIKKKRRRREVEE